MNNKVNSLDNVNSLDLELLQVYEKHWRRILPAFQSEIMLRLSSKINQKAENGNSLSGVSIFWPEDFETEDSLWIFLEDFERHIKVSAESNGFKITFI